MKFMRHYDEKMVEFMRYILCNLRLNLTFCRKGKKGKVCAEKCNFRKTAEKQICSVFKVLANRCVIADKNQRLVDENSNIFPQKIIALPLRQGDDSVC